MNDEKGTRSGPKSLRACLEMAPLAGLQEDGEWV